MVRLITVHDLKQLIDIIGLENFLHKLIDKLDYQFARWDDFKKIPRPCTHYPHGVIELMPISDNSIYTFKYVNGHPGNPLDNKQTVIALGLLAEVKHGYPLMISEMTLLTAIRTAATSALAAKYLARKNAQHFGIIGSGAQSEFQIMAHRCLFDLKSVRYYDTDPQAMKKFANNLQHLPIELIPCAKPEDACKDVDIITTATACKKHVHVLKDAWVKSGMHINGIGGDCPGKTELEASILDRCKIVVEYLEQSKIEGEIQALKDPDAQVYAELWELTSGKKQGRVDEREITLFDSVGFALEDFATLELVYELAETHQVGQDVEMIPPVADPKDLYNFINQQTATQSMLNAINQ